MTIQRQARCTDSSAGAARRAFPLNGEGEMRESQPDGAVGAGVVAKIFE